MKKYFVFILVTYLMACGTKKENPTGETKKENDSISNVVVLSEAEIKNASIEISTIEQRNINSHLQVNGMVDVPPQSMISVSFPLGGYLKTTKLLPGMRIGKGEVLAVLEDAQFIQLQQDYLMAKAKLNFAKADYERQRELSATQAGSEKTLQQATSEYENLKVLVKSLAQKLLLININPDKLNEETISRSVQIYSPINGFVSKVNMNIGKYVSPTDVLFELVDPSDIHLNLTVFEKDAAMLAVGQKVVAYTNNQPDKKHDAEIFLISKNINEDRAVQVHCHFEKYETQLLPGMFMNAIIDVNNLKVNALPDDAIVRWQNKFYVFISKGQNNFEMVEVNPANASDGYTALPAATNTSLQGKQIITKNAYTLLMKLKNSAEE